MHEIAPTLLLHRSDHLNAAVQGYVHPFTDWSLLRGPIVPQSAQATRQLVTLAPATRPQTSLPTHSAARRAGGCGGHHRQGIKTETSGQNFFLKIESRHMRYSMNRTIGPAVELDAVLPTTTQESFAAPKFADARARRNAECTVSAGYQEGFFEAGRNTLAYLDMKPPQSILDDGRAITQRDFFGTHTSRAFR